MFVKITFVSPGVRIVQSQSMLFFALTQGPYVICSEVRSDGLLNLVFNLYIFPSIICG